MLTKETLRLKKLCNNHEKNTSFETLFKHYNRIQHFLKFEYRKYVNGDMSHIKQTLETIVSLSRVLRLSWLAILHRLFAI